MAKAEHTPVPLLRVSRPVSACQRCRGAKIKCDGKLPACTACERTGRREECSSAGDQFAKGKERSYVASLETRIERLERQLSQARARRASVDLLDMASAASFFPPARPNSARTRKADRQEASSVDDLVSDFGFLSVNATARDFHGFTGEMSFARLVLSVSSLEPVPVKAACALPQRYEIAPLIQHYLEAVHVVYPVLLDTGLFASIDAVYGQGGLYASPLDHWLTLMVLAVSCASLARSRGDQRYEDALDYAAAASCYVERVIQPGTIFGIQAMLLMVLLAMWLPHHYNSWYLIGVASRAAIDLGLHQQSLPERQTSAADKDIRLRIFDCVYSLDRSISMVNQRVFSFPDDSTNAATPKDGPTKSQSPLSLGLEPATNLVKLRRIQSSYYQKIFQSARLPARTNFLIARDAIHDMEQWYGSLQPEVNQTLRRHAYCETLYSNVLMLTPPNWLDELPREGKFSLWKYALDYAEAIRSSINDASEAFGYYTSHDLLRVSFVARRFVSLLQRDHQLLISVSGRPAMEEASELLTLPNGDDISRRLQRSYDGMAHFEMAIEYFSLKYGFTDPLHEYQRDSSSLKQRLETWSGSPANGAADPDSWSMSAIFPDSSR